MKPASFVLVVDHDASSRKVMRELLEGMGCVVREASHGREALDLLFLPDQGTPTLILVDVDLPVMTGLELATVLRSYHRLSRVPVVLLSSLPFPPELPLHRLAMGGLRKPIERDSLLGLAGKLIGAKT
jgi:CheY-like chemotaxis protein